MNSDMIKPEKCGHLHLVYHFTAPLKDAASSTEGITQSSVHLLFYKQPVYKQLTLRWRNAKQLSGFNPLSPSNNKIYILKRTEVFSFVINIKKLLN